MELKPLKDLKQSIRIYNSQLALATVESARRADPPSISSKSRVAKIVLKRLFQKIAPSINWHHSILGVLYSIHSITFETAILVNLESLRLFASCTGAPISVTGELISVNEALLNRIFWSFNLAAVLLRVLFMAGVIVLILMVDRFWSPMFFSFYAMVCLGSSLSFVCGFVCLTRETGNFAMTWNLLVKYKSRVKSPKPMIWLLTVFFPLANLFPVALSIYLTFNPQLMIQFRFAVTWALEEGLLSLGPTYYALVTLATIADYWTGAIIGSIALSVLPFHMLFLESLTSLMTQLTNSSNAGISTVDIERDGRTLGEFVIALRVFNVGNAAIVFHTKIFGLFSGITSQSSLLCLDFSGNFLFMVILAYTGFTGPFLYPAIYHRAPAVGTGIQRAKSELLRVGHLAKMDAAFERSLQAISSKGIWVGSFHTFERESDLIYLGFIVDQVVGIVVADSA